MITEKQITAVVEDSAGYIAECQRNGETGDDYLAGVLNAVKLIAGHEVSFTVKARIKALIPVLIQTWNAEDASKAVSL